MEQLFDNAWNHLVTTPAYGGAPDPRVVSWPLIGDWRVPAAIGAGYLALVWIGMRVMTQREAPLNVKRLALLHNFVLFIGSLYMSTATLYYAYDNFKWRESFAPFCNPVDQTPFADARPSTEKLAFVLWLHYVSKAYEFVDTFIMIAKKNFRQITFLHVYHHATTFFPVWFLNVRYGPGGEAYFCCFLNSTVHVIMYGYYFFAALGIRSPLKRYITQFQMIQFLLFIGQSLYLIVTDCYQPRISAWLLLIQCTIFFTLFYNFYAKNYDKVAKGSVKNGKDQ